MTASLRRLAAGSEAGAYYTNDAAREAKPGGNPIRTLSDKAASLRPYPTAAL